MTQDEIIEMAIQAGMEQDGENFFSCNHDEIDVHITDLTAFAKLVDAKATAKAVEREREACAKVCEDKDVVWKKAGLWRVNHEYKECADAIRARGEST